MWGSCGGSPAGEDAKVLAGTAEVKNDRLIIIIEDEDEDDDEEENPIAEEGEVTAEPEGCATRRGKVEKRRCEVDLRRFRTIIEQPTNNLHRELGGGRGLGMRRFRECNWLDDKENRRKGGAVARCGGLGANGENDGTKKLRIWFNVVDTKKYLNLYFFFF